MSRFGDYDDYDHHTPPEFWEQACKRALASKRGLQALRDMEAALLTLPQPRLIEGHIAKDGEVCAIGAYALYKKRRDGRSRASVLAELEKACGHHGGKYGDDCYDAELKTRDIAESLGMAMTLASDISYRNDEWYGGLAPAYRWERTLNWVREQIAANPHAVTA